MTPTHRKHYERPPVDPAMYARHVAKLQQAALRIRRALRMPPVVVVGTAPGRMPRFIEQEPTP